jgi:hypothetical protein
LTLATELDAADTITIRVVALDNPARGIQSWIKLDETGEMKRKTRTNRAGEAAVPVVRCDEALGVWADPVLPYQHTGRFDCTSPLVIRVGKPIFAAALDPALSAVAEARNQQVVAEAEEWWMPGNGGIFDRFGTVVAGVGRPEPDPIAPAGVSGAKDDTLQEDLWAALDAQRDAEAAQVAGWLAAQAQWRGDETLAASYAALGAAAAFRALGLEPGDPERPLMTMGDAGKITLSEAGVSVVAGFQGKAGLEPTGVWTLETFAALPGP